MPDDSITVGADTSEMRRELAAAEAHAQSRGAAISKAFDHGAAGSERLLMSSHRVARQMGNLAQSLTSGGGAADIFATALEGVERSMHISLGALASLSIGAVLVQQFGAAVEAAQKLRMEVELLMVQTNPDASRFDDLDELTKKYDELRKKQQDIREIGSTWFGRAKLGLGELATGEGGNAQFRKLQDLGANAGGIGRDIAENQARSQHAAETGVNEGKFAEEREKLGNDILEKRQKIIEKYSINEQVMEKMLAVANAQYELEKSSIDFREAAAKRLLDFELASQFIKQSGDDVEIRSAQAKLDLALQTAAAATNDEDREQAAVQEVAARGELAAAQRLTEERRRQFQLQTDIANLTGDSVQKQRDQLLLEEEELNKKRKAAKPDDFLGIDTDLAKNAAGQRENQNSMVAQGIEVLRARSRANTGRGPDEQLAAAHREAGYLNLDLFYAKKLFGDQSVQVADINARFVEQRKKIEDIEFAEQQALVAAKARTLEMELQNDGASIAARTAATRAQYEAQIAQAIHDGKMTLADQLAIQEKQALLEQKIAEYMRTPEERRKEREDERHHRHAARTVEAREKDQADRAAHGAHNLHTLGQAAAASSWTPSPADAAAAAMFDYALPKAAAAGAPAINPGATGAASDAADIKQMTVETMHVKTMYVESIPSSNS